MCVSGIRACETALFIRKLFFFAYFWDLTKRTPIITGAGVMHGVFEVRLS